MADENSAGSFRVAAASAMATSPGVLISEQLPQMSPTASPEEALRLINEAHERERQVLFGNEGFAINALQVVSGGSTIAILGQFEIIKKAAKPELVLSSLSLLIGALALAVIAAFLRHEYKMWDVKATVSASEGDVSEQRRRHKWATRRLNWMRRCMALSAGTLVGALVVLVLGLWVAFAAAS